MDLSVIPILSQQGGKNNPDNIYEWLFSRYLLKNKKPKTQKALLDSDMFYIHDSRGIKLYVRG